MSLAIAGAWPCWFLMSVECEPSQSLEYAVHLFIHSFINIHQCCFRQDGGSLCTPPSPAKGFGWCLWEGHAW